MRQMRRGAAWRAQVTAWIIGAALVTAMPAVASSPPDALSMSEAAGKASADSTLQQPAARGLPTKPEGLDDAGWESLQQAIRKVAAQQARLARPVAGADGAADDRFGVSVALSGDTALVGAVLDDVGANVNQGSAFVFTRSATTWTLQAQLVADDGAAGDGFGISVALSNDTALVGATGVAVGANPGQGSAYVFTRSGATWTQQAKLVAADGAADDSFGNAVALSVDTALVGAFSDNVGANLEQGSAYVYTRSGTTWTQQAKLVAGDGAANDNFGLSVALSGDTALVGAPGDNVGANGDQGSAYVYTRSGALWTPQAILVAGNGATEDQFGWSVALSGDTALVGAIAADAFNFVDGGSAYVFTRSGTTWAQQAQLVAGENEFRLGDQFGFAVALSGDTALVGAYLHNVNLNIDQGSAYVFTRSGTMWTQQTKLIAADGATNDQFGVSVALSGDTALVGVHLDDIGTNADQGSAYIYTRSVTTWSQQAKLVAGNGAANDWFGRSVAVFGDTALVGALFDDVGANTDQGSAYVFTRSGATWTRQAQLVASDGAADDQFGWSVALYGDTALVGALFDDVGASTDQGSAYVFTRSGTTWTQQGKLLAGDGAADDQFGISVALLGDTALVGAYLDDVANNDRRGSAYVFTRDGTTWTQQAKLLAGDGAANDRFGWSVALSGNTALVGAFGDDVGANVDQGSAYVYTSSGTGWTQQAKLVAGDGAANDWFGRSVALSGDTALIGSYLDDVGANANQGSAYVFTRSVTAWTQQGKLVAGDGAAGDSFGVSVALSGDAALAGASFDDVGANVDQGSAYVFKRSGTTWAQQTQLVANDGAANDQFGAAVALSGGTALAGAPLAEGVAPFGRPDEGAAYVFIGVGTQAQSITFANPGPQAFGSTPTLSATASSGLPVSFSSATTSVCSITTGGTLAFLSIGTCTINADQAGDANYDPAPRVQQGFAVNAVAPGAPGIGTASAGNAQASVTFTAPGFTGGAPITGYTATATPGGFTGTGLTSPITVTGLTNGVTYTFTVTATNSVGPGPASAPSNAVTPRGPQAPLTATASPSTMALGGTSALGTIGGSGTGAVTYAVTAGASFCSVSGSTLTGTGVGTCTVTATKAGDASFNPASATVDVTVQPATDLEVSNNDGTPYAVPDGFVEYTILVANAGPLAAPGARLQNPVPTGLANALWTCTPVQGASCPVPSGTGAIDQTINLPVNATLRYVFSARVTAAVGATITSSATVAPPAGMLETDPADNTAADTNSVVTDGLFGNGFEAPGPTISVPMRSP